MAEPQPRGHFALLGFPVRVQPFFWLITIGFGASGIRGPWNQEALGHIAIWVAVIFVSILWHELGHAFAMRRYGFEPSITLHGMGGVTMWGRGRRRPSPGQRVIVSLAGPFAGFALGALVFGASVALGPNPHWAIAESVRLLLFINIGWGLCNLVPMLPWDGGTAVHAALDHFTDGDKALKAAGVITLITAVGIAGAILLWLPTSPWLLFLCAISASHGVRALRAKPPERAPKKKAAVEISPEPEAAIAEVRSLLESAGDPVRLTRAVLMGMSQPMWRPIGAHLSQKIAPRCDPAERAAALELAAWAYLLAADAKAAQAAADGMQPTHEASPILAALLAIRAGDPEGALRATAQMSWDETSAQIHIEVFALAQLGRLDAALMRLARDREVGGFVDAALFRSGDFEHAAALGARLFERFEDPSDAYNTACSFARAGDAAKALVWLERAIDAGFDDLQQLNKDPDLEPVRSLEGYAALRARVATAASADGA
ncbi:MAG TPA: hypothetical protein ENK57_21435 [Polyangiaceae bacterium]|nr:hypothetical protein [Polyangiaceae bacterium]